MDNRKGSRILEYPECFGPARFHNSSIDFKGEDFEFIPFEAGSRPVQLDMRESFGVSVRRMNGLRLIAIPYVPSAHCQSGRIGSTREFPGIEPGKFEAPQRL
ncbi:hypothetical protein CRYUN_Cryun23aG0045900 [Craigia yunnanensis]